MAAQAHFAINNHGSVVGFVPLTEDAAAWWFDNVDEGPVHGGAFYVEHRCARDIIDGLRDEGLI